MPTRSLHARGAGAPDARIVRCLAATAQGEQPVSMAGTLRRPDASPPVSPPVVRRRDRRRADRDARRAEGAASMICRGRAVGGVPFAECEGCRRADGCRHARGAVAPGDSFRDDRSPRLQVATPRFAQPVPERSRRPPPAVRRRDRRRADGDARRGEGAASRCCAVGRAAYNLRSTKGCGLTFQIPFSGLSVSIITRFASQMTQAASVKQRAPVTQ